MFNKFVLNPFLDIIKNYGKNKAFCISDIFYTYDDLARHISKVRSALQAFCTKSGNIAIVANDDIETYASIFAVWLEGLAYVPLHPQQPIERSLETISQANIDLVINSSKKNLFNAVQTIESACLEFTEPILQPKTTADDALAYILFTSGSTGKPKGVPITRSNIGAFMRSFLDVGFEIDHSDRCLQCFDLTFDVSVQSFLVPLTQGACVYTIPHDQIKYSYVYGLLEDHKLTFGVLAPSMLRYLRPYFNELNIPSMRYCILTAEASPVDLLKEWSSCIPNSEIYDFYGPTEATIYCTYYKFNRDGANKHLHGMLSIGKTMSGLTAIILDEKGKIQGANQKGELCISGGQIAPGYWNNPKKTAESFMEIECGGIATRFYKTGDSCYFDNDGDIILAGRLDYQVKIQGYRVELGEIEYHARECLHGQNAIAIAFENSTGNSEIAL
ncbi:MAG: AMP-binding protein, partial [Acidobacteria bacterium]|nr:AMP-binding protein [Acidobacteriota bacterium]